MAELERLFVKLKGHAETIKGILEEMLEVCRELEKEMHEAKFSKADIESIREGFSLLLEEIGEVGRYAQDLHMELREGKVAPALESCYLLGQVSWGILERTSKFTKTAGGIFPKYPGGWNLWKKVGRIELLAREARVQCNRSLEVAKKVAGLLWPSVIPT